MIDRTSLLSLIALAIAWSGPGASAAEDASSGTTKIAERFYRFPDAAFADGEVEHGAQAGLLLVLSWPQMTGIPVAREMVPPLPRSLQIMANSAAAPGMRSSDTALDQDIVQASHVMVSLNPRNDGQRLVASTEAVEDAPTGLVHVLMDKTDSLGGDLFLQEPLDRTSEFIRCDRKGPDIQFPLCSQEFATDGMLMKVSYQRADLHQWQEIHDAVVTYFRTHRSAA